MKKILLTSLLLVLLVGEAYAANDACSSGTGGIGLFKESDGGFSYKCNVKNFCSVGPKEKSLWDYSNALIKTQDPPPYAEILSGSGNGSENMDSEYQDYLNKVADDSGCWSSLNPLNSYTDYLTKASCAYRGTMNAIYRCAVVRAKIRIGETVLKQLAPKGEESELVVNLTKQIDSLKKKSSSLYCTNLGQGGESSGENKEYSIKRALLDNSTFQYCSYRYYLYYLDFNARNYLNKVIADENKRAGSNSFFGNSNTVMSTKGYMENAAGKISEEIRKTRKTYTLAFAAYGEFERTYASHLLLLVIQDDFLKIRENLKRLLNPISQVIYLASNAQK